MRRQLKLDERDCMGERGTPELRYTEEEEIWIGNEPL